MTDPKRDDSGSGLRLALDLGPLLVFFLTYFFNGGDILAATGIFMAATIAAMLASWFLTGKVSALQLISGLMVVVFGGLTIWFHDKQFIKIKPTIYYLLVSAILVFGLLTKRALLKSVLGHAYPGLSERGWMLLSRNWAFFFIVLAAANELVWRNFSESFWVFYKLWISLPATMVFAMANIPMLNRHGLDAGKARIEDEIPPQG